MTANCDTVRHDLLEADSHGVHAEHLLDCSACRAYAAKIAELEMSVKSVPVPVSVLAVRAKFIDDHTITPRALPTRRRVLACCIATAAAMLVGLSVLMMSSGTPVAAVPSTIERLIEWNVTLSDTNLAARDGVYRETVEPLHRDVQTLTDADRALADRLLAHGAWLTENDDPLDAAERFQDLADKIADTLETTGAGAYAQMHSRIMQHGVKANLKKAQLKKDKRSERREQRQAHLEKRSKQQTARLEKLAPTRKAK